MPKKKKTETFLKDLKEIFYDVFNYQEDQEKGEVKFSIEGKDVTYKNLQQVSLLLDTMMIDVHSYQENGHHCDPDGYCYCTDDSEINIYCQKVSFKQ